MDMLINGEHVSDMDSEDVINPFNGEVIDSVPISHLNNVDKAIGAANNAKEVLQEMSAFKVSNKLFNVCKKREMALTKLKFEWKGLKIKYKRL